MPSREIKKISSVARLVLHYGTTEEISGTGLDVVVAIGKSGREEITDCIRRLAENGIPPSEIDEKTLESCLTFRYDPDIVVKTGGDHLTDFLIWQSVYSELFFSDVNWKYFRRVDFLRVLRDYQSRITPVREVKKLFYPDTDPARGRRPRSVRQGRTCS